MHPSFRVPARLLAAALALAAVPPGIVLAQAAAPAQSSGSDPLVAVVGGHQIHYSDVKDAAAGLPSSAHSMPQEVLYPMVLDQLIDGWALVAEARKSGLDKDPAIQKQMREAEDRALQTAMLRKTIGPQITDEALRASYDQQIANKPGAEEVHARHILVPDEGTAKKIIAELDKGADFAALSKQYSKDPGAAQQGGDLGFFKQEDMVPEFAKAAFALKSGQVTQTPVHTQFGWHVIQVLERRHSDPPSFEESKDELRQKAIQDGVKKAVADARSQVKVERFNLDGSVPKATDSAEPPPAK